MSSCPNLDQLTDADYISALGRKADMANVPLTASIELTERCNLHCTHCYLGDQERLRHNRERELVTAQWMRILDEMADMGCLYLLITGGDPMLRKDFADIYRHARSRGFLVTLFTNGTLLTPTIIDLFREWPPYTLEITLYGVTRETYEKITGIPGSYMRCMAGIEQLEQLGIGLGLKTVLMRSNRHEFDEIATFCRTHSTDKFRFDAEIQGQFDGSGGPLKERLDPEEVVRMEFSDSERAADWQEYWQRRKGQKMA
ncbi:MAG: radical SAM protein, partial [Gammaproteobacteria bacterium]|nr:radical SAM protein [Gammaproteobacteria bacterium]